MDGERMRRKGEGILEVGVSQLLGEEWVLMGTYMGAV